MRTSLKMIRLISLLSLFLGFKAQGQEVYFSTGMNLTTYDFTGTDNLPLDFNSTTGQFYELGYKIKMMNERLHYGVGLALNNLNATAGDTANNYQWNSTFIGINNLLEYAIITSSRNPFELSAGIQMQLMHIINGEQKINGVLYDLTKETEFNGMWIQPGALLNAKYFVSDDWQLSLGYNYSVGLNLSNSTDEKLKFNNHQIRFGIHFNVN